MTRRPRIGARTSWSVLFFAALALAACGGPSSPQGSSPGRTTTTKPAAAPPLRVAVSTDMSWDDVSALVYLLERPDVDVAAIAVNGDGLTHCAPGVAHVRQLVAYLGHPSVAVACGSTKPLEGTAAFPVTWRQSADAFFGLSLPAVPLPAEGNIQPAVDLLDAVLAATPKTLVISLGPMTDLADLFARHPDVRSHVERIVAMAGAISVPGNEPQHGRAEWNVFIDPLAADRVLASGVPVTLVPLDACDDVPVTVAVRDALAAHERPGASEVESMLLSDPYYVSGAQYFWDPLAAMVATVPGLARLEKERLAVVQHPAADAGRTVVSPEGATVDVAVGADAPAFYESYLRILLGDPAFALPATPNEVSISYAKTGWSVQGELPAVSGRVGLRLGNESRTLVGYAVGLVTGGHTVADVDKAIRAGVTAPPAWFEVVLSVTVPGGHPATWDVVLRPGLYVVIGGGPNLPLRRLAAARVA